MHESIGYVALGSNVGDRRRNLRLGLDGMAKRGLTPARRSSVWETEPVGTADGVWFLNMVVRVGTAMPPADVLEILLDVELHAGRTRSTRNAPRSLDLDLLLLGDARIRTPRLTLPHPRMWARRFVLAPLAEIDAGLRDPSTGQTVEETLKRLDASAEVRRLGDVAASSSGPLYSSVRSTP